MGRALLDTVDYFPHYVEAGRTLFILEARFGNDGYSFWFKLLELLCRSRKHYFEAATPVNWHYLISRARVSSETSEEILNLLADLGNIDAELWHEQKIIWCQALLDNLEPLYKKRKIPLPDKPSNDFRSGNTTKPPDEEGSAGFPERKSEPDRVSAPENDQRKGKERKEPPPSPPLPGGEERESDFGEWRKIWPKQRSSGWLAAEKVWKRLAGQGKLLPQGRMLGVLAAQKRSEEWQREEGRFIPRPAKYLEDGGFLDESVRVREPPASCSKCGGSGFRKARPGEEGIGGQRPCECRAPDWQPGEARASP